LSILGAAAAEEEEEELIRISDIEIRAWRGLLPVNTRRRRRRAVFDFKNGGEAL